MTPLSAQVVAAEVTGAACRSLVQSGVAQVGLIENGLVPSPIQWQVNQEPETLLSSPVSADHRQITSCDERDSADENPGCPASVLGSS